MYLCSYTRDGLQKNDLTICLVKRFISKDFVANEAFGFLNIFVSKIYKTLLDIIINPLFYGLILVLYSYLG